MQNPKSVSGGPRLLLVCFLSSGSRLQAAEIRLFRETVRPILT
jgi:hypothetical protein